MYRVNLWIGEHLLKVVATSYEVQEWLCQNFRIAEDEPIGSPDLTVCIRFRYGRPFENFDVRVRNDTSSITYQRADYFIQVDASYREAHVAVYDKVALKHALMNLYSAFVVHHRWGLLVHASCAVQNGRALLFAGQSGAGKSTVARLSAPRRVLSDEATVVKVCRGKALVYDSPFRSDSVPLFDPVPYPLNAIYILRQSQHVDRRPMGRSDGILRLMNKVFYWSHEPTESAKVFVLHQLLAEAVPIYDLHFQKNDTFWRVIS